MPSSPPEAPILLDPFGEGHPGAYPAGPQGRPKARLMVAVAAVLAVVAGGFAIQSLTASDGASSPEGAVEALFSAIDDEDVIGVLEALHPGERDLLVPTAERLGTEASRLGLASDDLDLRDVRGIDLTVSDLEVSSTPLGDGVAMVSVVGGTIAVDGDLNDLPMGSIVRDLIDRADDEPDMAVSDQDELAGIELVARRSGGRWHVSLLYTLAELARVEMDPTPAPPAYGQGIVPKGAATPEDAVRETLDAALAVDVRRLIELMPPGEGDVLHDYGPMILGAIDEADPVSDVEVDGLELSVAERSGNQALVVVDRFRVTVGDQDDLMTVEFDDGCVDVTTTWTERFVRIDSSIDDDWTGETSTEGESGTSEWSSCDSEHGAFAPLGASDLGSTGTFGLVTVEHDGLWYLSPTHTLFDAMLTAVEGVDPDDLARTVRWLTGDWWLSEPPELWEACGIPEPGLDADPDEAEQAWEDCYDALPEDYEGPFGLFGMFGTTSADFDDWSDFEYSDEEWTKVGGPVEDPKEYFEYEEWHELEEYVEWDEDGQPTDATIWDARSRCYSLDDASREGFEAAVECLEELHAGGYIWEVDVQNYACLEAFVGIDEFDEVAVAAAEELYDECYDAARWGN